MRVKTDVLGVLYDNVTMQEALERGRALLEGSEAAYCVTPNAEIAYQALHDEAFRSLLNGAALVLPDGAGVVLGCGELARFGDDGLKLGAQRANAGPLDGGHALGR